MQLLIANQAVAQITNCALDLDAPLSSAITSSRAVTIDGCYTLQCYVDIAADSSPSTLWRLEGGDSQLSLSLKPLERGAELLLNGQKISSELIDYEAWSQITLIADRGWVTLLLDGKVLELNQVALPTLKGDYTLSIAEDFVGRMDEFRLWSVALDLEDIDGLRVQNTVNRFHPQWTDLAIYYPFDSTLLSEATPSEIVVSPVDDNPSFRYMTVTGYSSFVRHADRPFIDRDMHMMTNDLIMLDVLVDGYTGETYICCGDATIEGEVKHKSEYIGRSGVALFEGAGALRLDETKIKYGVPFRDGYSISAWVNLSEWSQGAYLYNRESSENSRFNIKFGEQRDGEIVVEIGANSYLFHTQLPLGEWHHVAVVASVKRGVEVALYIDNKRVKSSGQMVNRNDYTIYDVVNIPSDALVGVGLSAAVDNLVTRREPMHNFATEMLLESSEYDYPQGGVAAIRIDGVWRFDSADELAVNQVGWQSKLAKTYDIYKGVEGYKVRLGFITHEAKSDGMKVWTDSICSPAWRQRLIEGAVELAAYCDGVDLDFEWLYNDPQTPGWQGYHDLVVDMHAALPKDKTLSVSLHPVSYTIPLTEELLEAVDYFTFQNYGPSVTQILNDVYLQFVDKAVDYGYPVEKLHLSMTTLAVRNDNSGKNVIGYRDLDFSKIQPGERTTIYNGVEYYFNNVEDVKVKMRHLVERGCGGCVYFDMGNDVRVSSDWSLIKALNCIVSSNLAETAISEQ
ncbi:MAG: LamG-like jellyroll fold domain-containing protein [Rikenellaceae bacterium]